MSDWNPSLYTRFEDERTRPAAELLARVPLTQAVQVVDLGCGPGNSTELLAARYPAAHIVGLDSSQAMLAAARERLPALVFEHGDIAEWSPAAPVELVYANAALQWIPDHERLLPRLMAAVSRISVWLGSSRLSGICTASAPPGATAAIRRGSRRSWSGIHCSAAFA